jgi:DNA replication initiation complex subunit (GINS family)
MMSELITYDTLFELLQKEKARKEIQKLPDNFHKSFLKYLEEKTLILNSQKSKDSIFSTEIQKTEKQVENIRRIINDIYERRERKIIEAALLSVVSNKANHLSTAMLTEEITLFNKLKENLKDSRESILLNLLAGKPPEVKTKTLKKENNENNNVLIKFLASVPKFVGTDNFVYGPFEKEDISALPKNISTILITKKRAREIEVK